jgi:endonuclease III
LKPIDIELFIKKLIQNRKTSKAPIITFISERGATPFEILVSTLLSLRTKDEVTALAAHRLFQVARTPVDLVNIDEEVLKKLIYPVGFYPTKAKRLLSISRILLDQYNSQVPNSIDELMRLPGVGRKTANLVMTEGFKIPAVCVDTHVHRISNRIGYVNTKTPEKTELALREKLPRKHWIKYNELLVTFGQTVCRPVSPFCSTCPAADMCPKIGVMRFR